MPHTERRRDYSSTRPRTLEQAEIAAREHAARQPIAAIDEALEDGRIAYAEANSFVIAFEASPSAATKLLETREPDHRQAKRNFVERERAESAAMDYDKDAVSALYHLPREAVR